MARRKAVRRKIAYAAVLLVALFPLLLWNYYGRVRHHPLNPHYMGPAPLSAGISSRFPVRWPPTAELLMETETRWRHTVYRGKLEIRGGKEPRSMEFDYWKARRKNGAGPGVLIIPILEGSYATSRHLGGWLATQGISSMMVHRRGRWMDPQRPIEDMELFLRREVEDQRVGLRWLRSRPEIDPARIVAVGISMGAITCSVLTVVEPTLGGTILVMGGGDLPGIIATSEEEPVIAYREARLRATGKNLGVWKAHARKVLVSDPLKLAPLMDARKVLYIMTRNDKHVPFAYQLKLWDAMGQPRAITLPTGHYSSVLYIFYLRRVVRAFVLEGGFGKGEG